MDAMGAGMSSAAPSCTARNGSVIGGSRTSKSPIRERALYASTSSLVSLISAGEAKAGEGGYACWK